MDDGGMRKAISTIEGLVDAETYLPVKPVKLLEIWTEIYYA